MKSSVTTTQGLGRELKVEIPVERVKEAFNKVYTGIQRTAEIKGFRKGKAPLATIKTLYGDRVGQEVAQELVNESFMGAIDEHSLDLMGEPHFHVGAVSEETGFSYSAHFDVRPEVQIKKFEGLKVQKEKIEISEKEISEVLESLRESRFDTSTVFEDRSARDGDLLKIDFAGTINGEPLDRGQAEDQIIEIGANKFIPGFEEGLVGAKPGEVRQLNLKFPADYGDENIAGQPVQFQITVKQLLKKVIPELNDAFAEKVGAKNLEALKSDIRQELEGRETSRIQGDVRNNVLRALVAENPVEIPAGVKKEQKQRLVKDIQQRMLSQGMSEEQFKEYEQKWDKDFDESANFMVQSMLLVDALADKLNLRPSEKDFEERVQEHSKSVGIDMARLKQFYERPERRSSLLFQITEERVVEHLLSKAKIEEVAKEKAATT